MKCVKISKDHHRISINDVDVVLERSEVRHLIQVLDNSIDVCQVEEVEVISKEDYMKMIAKAKEDALSDNDEDCDMCGA
jgi:cellobiose-specific phosphotransferase system component IIB